MRLAIINATGGGMSGGYRTYLRNVLLRLAQHPDVEAVLCAAPAALRIETWFPPLHRVTFHHCAPFRFLRREPDRVLRAAMAKFTPDVVFIPVERYLRLPGIPLVVMLQNMGPLLPVAGNPLSERLRYVTQRNETRIAVQRADRVIVPTNFVKEFLVKEWYIPEDRVTTIYYGSLSPLNIVSRRPWGLPENWKGKFLFTAGSIEPYRGLEDLMHAMRLLPLWVKLVIAGEARWNMVRYQRRLIRWVERNHLTERIRWVGALSQEEMAWCDQHCTAFVMASRLESFGMIGLEALAHGCICIAADNPPLPEIFDTAAWYYPPKNAKVLAEKINAAFSLESAARQAMSEAARQRATMFSWDRNVEQLIAVLTEVHRTSRTLSS